MPSRSQALGTSPPQSPTGKGHRHGPSHEPCFRCGANGEGWPYCDAACHRLTEQALAFFWRAQRLGHYHPETLLKDQGLAGFGALLQALEETQCHVLFTHPNADAGSDRLLAQLRVFVQKHPKRSWVISSLGQQRYLAALQLFEAMAGNSSSGVIEAPLVGMPVLNIGGRQAGRLRHACVRDVDGTLHTIIEGLQAVLRAGTRTSWPRPRPQPDSAPTRVILNWLRSRGGR